MKISNLSKSSIAFDTGKKKPRHSNIDCSAADLRDQRETSSNDTGILSIPVVPLTNKLHKDEAANYIAAVEATSNVVRYHGHCVIRQQSVADHSCRVGMLAYAIALEKYHDEGIAAQAASFGLFHDACEGMVKSDVNASVKAQYGIRDLVRKVEQDGVDLAFNRNSWHGQIFKKLFLEEAPESIYSILRLADSLDFGLYVHTELLMGNRTIMPLLEAFKKEFAKHPDYLKELEINVQ
jgi:5'-deoxynucleotidase YfbR-like HD superfamily hydrolase